MKIRFISFSDKVESEMKPNLTLMASLEVTAKDGKKGISRGFWGDVVTRYVVTRYVVTSLRRYWTFCYFWPSGEKLGRLKLKLFIYFAS
jgi:hypothetical protein